MLGLKRNTIIGFNLCAMLLTSAACNAQLLDAFVPRKENAIRDFCHSQQKIILAAIEMYNMDNPEMIANLTDTIVREPGPLIPKYLNTPVKSDYGCSYSSQGDLTANGYIQCREHGAESTVDIEALALEDFKKAAQELIAAGKTVDGTDADGTTALHLAVETNMPLVVEYLLSLKADPTLKNKNNKNALDLAVEKQNLRMARLLKAPGTTPANPSGKAMQPPIFHPSFDEVDGNVQIKTGDNWQPLTSTTKCSLPFSLRTGPESRVLFSMGKIDYSHLNIDLSKLEELLGNGISVEVRQGSELVIEQPVLDHDFPIVTGLPFHLQNGEIRLSASGFTGTNPKPAVKMGEKMAVQCQSGVFKFAYDSARDSGKLVVRIGSANAKLLDSSDEGIELTGFYKLDFEKGKLGERQQANIAEEFD